MFKHTYISCLNNNFYYMVTKQLKAYKPVYCLRVCPFPCEVKPEEEQYLSANTETMSHVHKCTLTPSWSRGQKNLQGYLKQDVTCIAFPSLPVLHLNCEQLRWKGSDFWSDVNEKHSGNEYPWSVNNAVHFSVWTSALYIPGSWGKADDHLRLIKGKVHSNKKHLKVWHSPCYQRYFNHVNAQRLVDITLTLQPFFSWYYKTHEH